MLYPKRGLVIQDLVLETLDYTRCVGFYFSTKVIFVTVILKTKVHIFILLIKFPMVL